MLEVECFFTEQFLTYLADSYGSMASKIYLVADDSEIAVTEDIATIPSELSLVKKKWAYVENTIEKNTFECTGKIKDINPKHKNKSVLIAGILTEMMWGSNTGTLTDLSPWGLESANGLLEESPLNTYGNRTAPSIWGETLVPSWGSDVAYGYSSEPYLYYSSDQPLFIKEFPTEVLTKEIFNRVFNSSTDYSIYPFRGTPTLINDNYDGTEYSYWSSNSDFYSMTIPDLFPLYSGSHMDGTNVVPISIGGVMSYPGMINTFAYSSTGDLISTGSASTLTSFVYQTETGLMLGTFSDFQVKVTSTDVLSGFFVVNEKLKVKNQYVNDEIGDDTPLILFGCRINGSSGFQPTHQPGQDGLGQDNFTIMKTPKVSLSMDVVII
jgi:hypothetical protein